MSTAASTGNRGSMEDKLAGEALRSLLAVARPALAKSRHRGMQDRARGIHADPEQVGALRKAGLVLAARLAEAPDDHGMAAQLAALLADLYLANFANSGVIAEQLSQVDIDEESFFEILDSRLFGDEGVRRRRNAKFSTDLNSLQERMKEKREEPAAAPARPASAASDAFTSARSLLDPNKLKPSNNGARKNLGGKRWAMKEETHEEAQETRTEFGCYNLAKTPSAARPALSAPKNPEKEPKEEAAVVDERLQGIEPRLIEMIKNEIMHRVDSISWDRIAGLEHAKKTIFEIVIWPMQRPDLFSGLRGPPKGLLLFGPPGTGKTMIGKCIASQAKATFFSISASSLTSKWVGESEKMMRALFAVARCQQPAVIFIDEIDSMLCQRSDGEVEATRRLKTEFLVQFDGTGTSSDDRILVIGATNRPQELDEAARRRLVKRLYIPLPSSSARQQLITSLLANQKHSLTEPELLDVVAQTDGYSGSDMDSLCREAALGPIRAITDILAVSAAEVRAIGKQDFDYALTQVRASVSSRDLEGYDDWNSKYGSLSV